MTMDGQKLEALLGTMVNELGAAANAALVITGERLGLYRALANGGEITSAQLAAKTGTHERYVREWLGAQAASGFVTYSVDRGTFSMSPEQAAVFADPESPFFMTGGFESLSAVFSSEPKLAEAFKTGKGLGWGEHCNCLFCGVEKFFRPAYKANLVGEWLPALEGVTEKLQHGARVADIGCGHGASTLIMAEAFPNARFIGFDFHGASVDQASDYARDAGLTNVHFEVASAQDFPGQDYDLVTIFDALHDMGDPVGACRHIRQALKSDGAFMVVEPAAGDRLEDNLNPIGRLSYAFSTSICVPSSLAQDVGLALGGQAGEARIADIIRKGDFSRCKCVVKTPFNMIMEARP